MKKVKQPFINFVATPIIMIQTQKSVTSYLGDLEKLLEEYLVKKAPALPDGIKEAIVKFGPYLALVLLLMALPVVLGAFGLGGFLLPVSYMAGVRFGLNYTISMIFTIIVMALELIALPGLFKRKISSWNLMFYATLVEAVHNLVLFNLGGLIIGTLLGLYILFQIKSYYK